MAKTIRSLELNMKQARAKAALIHVAEFAAVILAGVIFYFIVR